MPGRRPRKYHAVCRKRIIRSARKCKFSAVFRRAAAEGRKKRLTNMSNDRIHSRNSIQKRLKKFRRKRKFALHLTSLIDVFMILLVFLIKNFSTRPEMTLLSQNINLPISTASKSPEMSIAIAATKYDIFINGKWVETIGNIGKQKKLLNPKIYETLLQEKKKTFFISSKIPEIPFRGKVIIQADKLIPYKIIKKIMYTCGQAEFGDISLHVLRKEN